MSNFSWRYTELFRRHSERTTQWKKNTERSTWPHKRRDRRRCESVSATRTWFQRTTQQTTLWESNHRNRTDVQNYRKRERRRNLSRKNQWNWKRDTETSRKDKETTHTIQRQKDYVKSLSQEQCGKKKAHKDRERVHLPVGKDKVMVAMDKDK